MKTIKELKEIPKLVLHEIGEDGGTASLYFSRDSKAAFIVFSFGGGWDHVSVSYKNRCCTWEEMCMIKDIFFNENECVVQFHPAQKDYINLHPHTLHLWKKQGVEFEMPPKYMV